MPEKFEDEDLDYARCYYEQYVTSHADQGIYVGDEFDDLESEEQIAISAGVEAAINKYIEENR